jgi:putative ABC transport system ATP-binding protein
MKILVTVAHEESAIVLAVTHDPRLIPFADRILHLEDGALKGDESPTRNPSVVNRSSQQEPSEELVQL